MSVALLTPNWLGDVVMAAPAVKALARALAEADPPERLAVYAPAPLAPLVSALLRSSGATEGAGLRSLGEGGRAVLPADAAGQAPSGARPALTGVEVVAFRLRRGLARLGDRVALARRMRSPRGGGAGGHRTIVLFPNSFGSGLAACLARIPERVGTAMHARGMLITRKVEPQGPAEHLGEAYLRVAQAAAGRRLERRPGDLDLTVPDEARDRAASILRQCGLDVDTDPGGERFVAIAPGAAYGPAKQWGERNFAELARLVSDRGLAPVVVGTRADSATAKEIARAAGGACRVVDLTGRTGLVELAGVLALASGFVGNDSGAAHLAAALGTPAVVVYLSTDPTRTAQRGRRVRIVTADVDCRPCMRRTCPGGHYRCRDAVAAGEVARALPFAGHPGG